LKEEVEQRKKGLKKGLIYKTGAKYALMGKVVYWTISDTSVQSECFWVILVTCTDSGTISNRLH